MNKDRILDILKRSNLDLDFIRITPNYAIYKVYIKNLFQELEINEEEYNVLKEWLK